MQNIRPMTPEPEEEWRYIPGVPKDYQASSLGRIRSKRKYGSWKVMKTSIQNGYYHARIKLFDDKPSKKMSVARLVATAFHENPNNHPVVNHISGVKTDNSIGNLEWCTYSYNSKHAFATGLNRFTAEARRISLENSSRAVISIAVWPSASEAARRLGTTQRSLIDKIEHNRKTPRKNTKAKLYGHRFFYLDAIDDCKRVIEKMISEI